MQPTGGLAVLGRSAATRYQGLTRVGHAQRLLLDLSEAAMVASERERFGERTLDLCGSASRPVPSEIQLVRGKAYTPTDTDWCAPEDVEQDRGFPCLRFRAAKLDVQLHYRSNSSPSHRGSQFAVIARSVGDDGRIASQGLTADRGADGRMVLHPQLREWAADE
jgi:hypothetical protein